MNYGMIEITQDFDENSFKKKYNIFFHNFFLNTVNKIAKNLVEIKLESL